ncbi:hypothetical protein PIB30_096279, partial [Stylosanthes scabra]|nr:hypothetical protein [Stylosanthes scabra]
ANPTDPVHVPDHPQKRTSGGRSFTPQSYISKSYGVSCDHFVVRIQRCRSIYA